MTMKDLYRADKALVKKICDRMDVVFKKHIGSKIPPYQLTDSEDIIAIAAGMGLIDFTVEDGVPTVRTKKPIAIYWNGEKFEVAQLMVKP